MSELIIRSEEERTAAFLQIAEMPIKSGILLVVSRPKSLRSAAQNRYYWGVLLKAIRDHIHNATGRAYPAEDLHEEFKARYGPITIFTKIDGGTGITRSSSRDYDVQEFSDYLLKIEAYAAGDLGIILPTNPHYQLIHGGSDAEGQDVPI